MTPSNVHPLPGRFQVELLPAGDVVVVVVHGEVDLVAESLLTRALSDAMDGSPAVLVDLCACTFMDSTGLGVLLAGARQAKAARVRLGVACLPDGAPRALFDMVLGHGFFTASDSRAAGLDALRAA